MKDYPFDLGSYSRTVTTTRKEAQVWFDRGLNWTFAYNHEEAVRCFQRAAEADPACAMAWWGISYAVGPNYNMPWWLMDADGQVAAVEMGRDAAAKALALVDTVTPAERALIEALPARYPEPAPIDDMSPWNDGFADAMRVAHEAHRDDLEIACIFVEAMMNRTPWQMWDLVTGTPVAGADTLDCKRVLEHAFTRAEAWAHPGLLHLYVHLMEMSPTPEAALKMGDTLRTLVPDAGHLIHMPTHIDVLCGDYQNVVHWNQAAIVPDLKFFEHEGAANIYTGYRQHNYHFVICGALFLGQIGPALEAVKGLRDTTPKEILRIPSPPMADYFESFLSFEPHVLVRFGRWRDCTRLALPEDQALYCTLTAFVWYARALGHAALGEIAEADAAEAEFQAARSRVPDTRLLHNNTVVDLLAIADAMLTGEILYRKGEFEAAFAHLRRAVTLEDMLPYDEPWGWMQPARHALGALLFEQGRVEEAEAAFREDLGLGGNMRRATVHPDNVWALKGLHDCLLARGEEVEIVHVRQRLDLAQARADTPVRAPCGCAQAAMAADPALAALRA